MDFSFSEEQEELRRSARSFLADFSSAEQVRQTMAVDPGFDAVVWKRIAKELGWTSIIVPEQYGGIGWGQVELVALMEEAGAALLCAPLFSSVCLGAQVLLCSADDTAKQAHLPAIAAGDTIATLALAEASGRWDAAGIETQCTRDGEDYVLSGTKTYVTDGHVADLFLVAARSNASTDEDGVSLFAVPADTEGLQRKALVTMDQTRRQAEITLDSVRVPASARVGAEGGAWPAIERTLDLAAIALAAEQVGGAQRCLDLSVEYAKERIQFGRPIGSFQAIKHKCADMFLLVESARSAAYYAGYAASVDDPELPVLASLAKAYCSDAYFRCAAEAIQIHGGVGFTWEYDVHMYFKRARAAEQLFGDPAFHRERVACRTGL
ncbi:MAG: acyl-CoA dehydrogenase [Myxococcales bacterium]|jgi:alkylation response protein AidB-like acyl-CoA dehydrogenase|nr:MAG: acyl-CoA dehydrogenase [Myxococcales bacterium]